MQSISPDDTKIFGIQARIGRNKTECIKAKFTLFEDLKLTRPFASARYYNSQLVGLDTKYNLGLVTKEGMHLYVHNEPVSMVGSSNLYQHPNIPRPVLLARSETDMALEITFYHFFWVDTIIGTPCLRISPELALYTKPIEGEKFGIIKVLDSRQTLLICKEPIEEKMCLYVCSTIHSQLVELTRVNSIKLRLEFYKRAQQEEYQKCIVL